MAQDDYSIVQQCFLHQQETTAMFLDGNIGIQCAAG
jgi:hypothetical protein